MNEDDELINFLKGKYQVVKNADGSYSIITSTGSYTIVKTGFKPVFGSALAPEINKDEESPLQIGRDDAYPGFENEGQGSMRGMIPTYEEILNMNKKKKNKPENPLIKKDPFSPFDDKNEPDPDNYDPGKFYD